MGYYFEIIELKKGEPIIIGTPDELPKKKLPPREKLHKASMAFTVSAIKVRSVEESDVADFIVKLLNQSGGRSIK